MSIFSIINIQNFSFDPFFNFQSVDYIEYSKSFKKRSVFFSNYKKEIPFKKGNAIFFNKLFENSNNDKFIFLPDD